MLLFSSTTTASEASKASDSLYATTPPGHRACWSPELRWVYTDPQQLKVSPDQPVVMTVVSDILLQTPMHKNFLFGLLKHGYTQVVALHVEPIKDGEEEIKFWLRRQKVMRDGVKNLNAPPGAVVTIVDGTDLLFVAGPATLLERFHRIGANIVYGAKMLCDTPSCRQNSTIEEFMRDKARAVGGVGSSFLNAGNVMGTVEALLPLLGSTYERMLSAREDDQAALVGIWFASPSLFSLDYGGTLFAVVPPTFSLFSTQWRLHGDGEHRQLRGIRTGIAPPVLHFAGLRTLAYHTGATHRTINPCQHFLATIYDALIHSSASSPPAPPSTRVRLVVSLTSTAQRLPHIRPVLESLLRQTVSPDVIYLNLDRTIIHSPTRCRI